MPRLSKIGAAALAAFGWTSGSSVSADFLVIAGGGGSGGALGGNYAASGGGGAGGYRTSAGTSGGGASAEGKLSLNPTLSYTVIVGAGGTGVSAASNNGGNGSDSTFSTITSVGGGGSGSSNNNVCNGAAGGSGGASAGRGPSTGGAGTANQGFKGGDSSVNQAGAPGGGGAGSAGVDFSGVQDGTNGGNGVSSSITGSAVSRAGGGGGGAGSGTGGTGQAGGGNGSIQNINGTNGTANTGGGAGGAGSSPSNATSGGNGGSGVVIISYVGAQQFGGGIVTTSGANTIHTFTTSGTLSPLSSLTASSLVVAGGGGGGFDRAGGGGAGGFRTGSGITIDTNSIYLVTVGAGGSGSSSGANKGSSGSDSVFLSTTSTGGGGGGSGSNAVGANGGSGGGSRDTSSGGAGSGNTPSTSPSQGNNGGSFGDSSSTTGTGGGGGGAGAVGSAGKTVGTGIGGSGSASSISGSSVTYAGGGGGGGGSTAGGSAGGSGGGGAGGNQNSAGTAGTANLGGGGGGGGDTSGTGGTGGSGVVIISYPGSTQQMAGGTVTVAGGNVIHTFTSSGYLAPIYSANNSLRFRSSASAYLNRTPASAGNRKTWTWSGWVKRGALSSGSYMDLFTALSGANDFTEVRFHWNANDDTLVFTDVAGGTTYGTYSTNVYRDPSAWYHVVCSVDTTQATNTNRVKLYVNGVQVTQNAASGGYPLQNTNTSVNATVEHRHGGIATYGRYFDGYMDEINFIDGQALTPSSFGTSNGLGVWQPIRYGGSYGTNGFYLPFTVDRTQLSYAFNTTPSYLTSSTAGIMPLGNTTWSIECYTWFNSVPSSNVALIANTATGGVQIFYRPAINTVEVGAYAVADVFPATTLVNNIIANAWNHFVFTSNGTQLRIFANGILIGYLASSYSFAASQSTVYIGTNDTTSSQTLNGFISNLRVCNGSIPTTYQTSSTTIGASIFTTPTAPLTTTSQGAANVSLLTCQSSTIIDNSSSPKTLVMTGTVTPSNIGPSSNPFYDQSPQGNNWTPNNISLVNGTTLDSMTDVPTLTSATVANYSVLDPLDPTTSGNATLSNANLTLTTSAANRSRVSSIGITNGKWYAEVVFSTSSGSLSGCMVGISQSGDVGSVVGSYLGSTANSYGYNQSGDKYNNGGSSAYGAAYTNNDVIGIAFDADNGTVTFYKNNSSQGTAFSSLSTSATWFIGVSGGISSGSSNIVIDVNFGQRPFAYTPPTGFVRLNTFNLPTPTIGATASTQADDYFNAVLYSGNNSTQNIAVGFQPDWVWSKCRNVARSHRLSDAVRGSTRDLYSDTTAAEQNDGSITSFISTGFSLNNATGSAYNTSGETYVSWAWKANGAGSTNTAGSITSTVSANTTAGFSIVTYTGTGANATVGHGLGVAPSMVIVKNRSAGSTNWCVYHVSVGNQYATLLNSTSTPFSNSNYWNNTTPTSTVFSLGNGTDTNGNTNNLVAYCFAPIAGYSAFGSYTGNGSTDGTFVFTGFRPRYVLIKRTNTTGDWIVYDSARSTYNGVASEIYPNLSNAEDNSSVDLDFVSNGIKLRNSGSGVNASGDTYIYACFAESPFKYANARQEKTWHTLQKSKTVQ